MSATEETAKQQEPHETRRASETDSTPDTQDEHTDSDDDQRPASRDGSDKDTDTFEDAVETGSVRSLTKRQRPVQRLSVAARTDSDYEDDAAPPLPAAVDSSPEPQEQVAEKKAPRPVSQVSAGSLDNVNLEDDENSASSSTGVITAKPPVQQQQPTTEPAAEKSAPPGKTKTMSFSSITNALPPMPWSPPPTDSRSKSPPAAAVAPPPAPAPAPAPAATGRKFNSPFSWLSRSTPKEPPVVQPTPSSRRNTASSVATMTSNPEMMLSKLEEEKDEEGGESRLRNSLKDRFKQIRMQGEAAAPGEDEKAAPSAAGEGGEAPVAAQPPVSPLPPNLNNNLAPGTASGVTAGPSSLVDVPVDWDLWQSVVYEGPAAVARTSPEELNKAIATGIPHAIRGVIWQVLAQSKNVELEAVYRELVVRGTDKERKDKDRQSGSVSPSAVNGNASSSASSVRSGESGLNGAPSPTEKDTDSMKKAHAAAAAERQKKEKEDLAMLHKLEKTIRRDLGARTSFSKYAAAQGLQEGLFGVCKAYALFDEGVGYAQGMNFLAMPLLFNMPEEEAFCLLVRLMNQYHLRDLFIQDMPGLHLHLYQFERLLEDLEPALYCHLRRRHISPHLYATQWFLTLFAYRFPLQLVLRIYDLILSEGLSAILKFGTVLMQKNAAALLAITDMAQLTTFLKDRVFDVYIDATPSSNSILENGFFGSSSSSIDKEVYRADQLVRDACEVKITPEMLKAYQVEWEEKTRTEKEREAELEALRASNTSYAIRMRKLEERLQQVDAEQASLATELVHTKVDNDELRDENEGLKIQVQELRIVIEKQPTEIEAAWQLERDDLMKRNGKVHEENQKLEKDMSELEEELVQTKMLYAEINAQHETLTRRWTDLKRQFQ
ncbi:rab-GTPase-TBC domain-containing protein [Staphylotrichum tortipilum]|uniref:GTPase-activating protein GYP5 n=1 Tax=Staphylotrichum tortipilum TaxID=2831512 RepID=A0AAN6MMX4_9PEZI|nr:rab-GTPase-TBC domain-containing protein [Staphylotrichum longicolle]